MIYQRRGIALLEITVASILLGVMLIMSVRVISWTQRARRDIDERAMALQVAANRLDELTSLPWDEITAERLGASKLAPEEAALVSSATLDVSLKELGKVPAAKQITVALKWPEMVPRKHAPIRLTAWVYRVSQK